MTPCSGHGVNGRYQQWSRTVTIQGVPPPGAPRDHTWTTGLVMTVTGGWRAARRRDTLADMDVRPARDLEVVREDDDAAPGMDAHAVRERRGTVLTAELDANTVLRSERLAAVDKENAALERLVQRLSARVA